ncbi:hypothetical protein [Pseudomonas putida]|uniref:Uncharacterized protein n=1 Tax=Pseudomonas putida TaxID=303 RepID=A0A8I1EHT8_PSEPU|nr:hypothetical protein [Pseudomonas putida]MBI6885776.1 hypothetical protein [Pseudomonas putida]
MSYNRRYSKNFGVFLMLLAVAIYFGFSSVLGDIESWGVDSTVYQPSALLWAFSSVGTFFVGLAFYRGVFLMSEHVIKPKNPEKVESEAAETPAA